MKNPTPRVFCWASTTVTVTRIELVDIVVSLVLKYPSSPALYVVTDPPASSVTLIEESVTSGSNGSPMKAVESLRSQSSPILVAETR